MLSTPVIPKPPLREIMLDAHEQEVKHLYEIPMRNKLRYSTDSTQILVNDTPIHDFLKKQLSDTAYVSKIFQTERERRKRLIEAHAAPQAHSSDALFHLQFNYELLAIDHLVDPGRVMATSQTLESRIDRQQAQCAFLSPSSGITFYEEVRIKELESLGYLLNQQVHNISEDQFFFDGKDFTYLLKHTLTREKLIRIILDYTSVEKRIRDRYDSLLNSNTQFENPSCVYAHIKDLRLDQARRRGMWQLLTSKLSQHERDYIWFVGAALDFNERNRLLRSISFFHIMKDESISPRFDKPLEERRNGYR